MLLSAKFDINILSNISVKIIDEFANIKNVLSYNIYMRGISQDEIESFEYNLRKNKLKLAINS